MIARIWRGWTAGDTADDYEAHLHEVALPQLAASDGNLGAYVLRRPSADGVEFMSVSLWLSVEALGVLAGSAAPEEHRLLVGRQTIPARWELVANLDFRLAAAA